MVSFWPWKADDASPASFEKALSTLSAKISKKNAKLDSLRQTSRRFNALWTLYTSFAYLLYTVILVLVNGWQEWGVSEYAVVAGGPVFIYLVRRGITAAYSFRISKIQNQSDDLQKQRDTTIEKLKTATKYNTTQELLKKYGGTPPANGRTRGDGQNATPKQGSSPAALDKGRTTGAPPPTANIPRRNGPISLPGTPLQGSPRPHNSQAHNTPLSASASVLPWQQPSSRPSPSEEFAPNAFPSTLQYASRTEGSRWYDRFMDVLLGEDETLPKNRLALICTNCRLVNGQAPPRIQRLEDVGRWRCAGCRSMNGDEFEAKRLVAGLKQEATGSDHEENLAKRRNANEIKGDDVVASEEFAPEQESDGYQSDITQYSESSGEKAELVEPKTDTSALEKQTDNPRRRSARAKVIKGTKRSVPN